MRQLKITKSITNRESASLDKYLQEIGREDLITIHEYMDGDEYFVIGVRNVDRVAREQMYVDKIAYMDVLTGARNKNSYQVIRN